LRRLTPLGATTNPVWSVGVTGVGIGIGRGAGAGNGEGDGFTLGGIGIGSGGMGRLLLLGIGIGLGRSLGLFAGGRFWPGVLGLEFSPKVPEPPLCAFCGLGPLDALDAGVSGLKSR